MSGRTLRRDAVFRGQPVGRLSAGLDRTGSVVGRCSSHSAIVSTESSPAFGARVISPRPTWTRSCARSDSPCSRQTSTWPWSSPCSPHPRAGGRRGPVPGAQPGSAGQEDRARGAHRDPRGRDACGSPTPPSRRPSCSWRGCRAPARPPTRRSWPGGSEPRAETRILVGADLQRPAAVQQLRHPCRPDRRAGLLRSRRRGGLGRRRSRGGGPRRQGGGSAASVATCSSATPRGASRSTAR